MEKASGQEELRWRRRAEASAWAKRVDSLAALESDRRVQIWLRVRVGGERITEVARRCGYSDSTGAWRVVHRLETAAKHDRGLAGKLKRLQRDAEMSHVRS